MLTPDDLTSTRFTTTRLREGYEASEVDEFLVRTTETLQHRDAEIRDLHEQVAAGCSCPASTMTDATHGISVVEGSRAAARLLEIAARNSDELLEEAKAEAATMMAAAHAGADQLTATSHATADQLMTSARAEADQVRAAARTEAERVHAELDHARTQQTTELDRHRTTVLSEVAERQTALEAEVTRLQQLDHDHRDRMRDYLTQQLAQIEPTTTD